MKILGLSAFHSNAAAALVVDGECVAAAQEERFSRIPRDAAFPKRALRHVLAKGGVEAHELDSVVFYEKPLRRFERLLYNQLRYFPAPARIFSRTMFTWLGDRMWLKNRIASELGVDPDRVLFTSHHQAHAAGAYLPSPFEEAAVLVVDGAGERSTTSLSRGEGTKLELLAELPFPHSLGLLYSAFTQYLGFEPDRDEAQVEALAAHGEPRHDEELSRILEVRDDGSFSVAADLFRFSFDGERTFGDALEEVFGPARIPGAPLDVSAAACREADLAASLQRAVERALLGLANELHRRVPSENLCVSGVLALNRTAMSRLHADGPFRNLYVQPAADDAGAALGAALLTWHVENGEASTRWRRSAADLGPELRPDPRDEARTLDGTDALVDLAARTLAEGELVGWARGLGGFGPGSMGGRVCLANPVIGDVRDKLTRGLAPRSPFLPLPIAVRAESAAELMELPEGADLPLAFGRLTVQATGLRELAPAVVGPDGSVLPRLVHADDQPVLHALLAAVERAGGPPVLVELDLAPRGEPCVRGEAEALGLFDRTELALLVVDDRVYERAPASA